MTEARIPGMTRPEAPMAAPRMRASAPLAIAKGLAALALFSLPPAALAQETPAAAPSEIAAPPERAPPDIVGDVTIQPIYHASLMLTWNGVDILFDPAQGAARLAGLPEADIILVTDIHPDHFLLPSLLAATGEDTVIVAPQAVSMLMTPGLRARTIVLANAETTEIAGVLIEAIPMYNVGRVLPLHPQGRGNGYVVTLGETRIYVAGDTDRTPEMDALADIDVAFLPMRPPFTMTMQQAAEAVLTFRPAIVYPFHYGGDNAILPEDVSVFAELVAAAGPAIEVRLREWYPQ